VKNLKEWVAVQELYKRKVLKLQIAKQLGISRNTVKRLIRLKEEPKYSGDQHTTKVDEYIDLITLWRTSPEYDFNGTRIFRGLKNRGYTGTINPIYRALKRIDEGKVQYHKLQQLGLKHLLRIKLSLTGLIMK
jgi:transposase